MLDYTGKFCLIVRRSELRLEVERLEDGTRPALQEGHHFLDLAPGPFVGGFKVIGPDACDEDELLLVRIKDDELVKEHEVDVLEIGILGAVKPQRRLGVLDIVVGEIADKAAGEGGKSRQFRTFAVCEDLADGDAWMRDLLDGFVRHVIFFAASDAEASIEAGELERWVVAKEGVAAPWLVIFCTF